MSTVRTLLGGRLRRAPAIAAALDVRPSPMRFPDGVTRTVPHWLAVEAREWEGGPAASELLGAYAAYEGGDVVDVGAWRGIYSLGLAPKARPGDTFVSLEPDPKAFPVLLEALAVATRLFPGLRFVALPHAAGTGERAALVWPNGDEGPSAHPRIGSDGDGEQTVRVDDLVRAVGLRPTFVKIDVEGAELDVLLGMPDVVAAGTALLVELHPWQDYGELPSLLPGYERSVVSAKWGFERTLWRRPS